MDETHRQSLDVLQALAALDPDGPPALTFLRRASAGIQRPGGTLLCLSASFNPVTIAHTALIREAERSILPQEILLLLSLANVDKRVTGLPLARRFELLLRLTDRRPDMSVAAVAHGRFVDKMDAIHAAYPAGTRLVFLLGFDTLTRLFDAKYYEDREQSLSRLFARCECMAANRGANGLYDIERFLAQPDVVKFAKHIHAIRLPDALSTVSATDVRARLAHGQSIAGLVPEELQATIEAWGSRYEDP